MVRKVTVYPFEATAELDGNTLQLILDELPPEGTNLLLDRDSIFNHNHIASGILHAARALIRGKSRANDKALEIIRWLAGVHQVSEGIRMISPKKDTKWVLVANLPHDWPNDASDLELPEVDISTWQGRSLPVLSPTSEENPFGGVSALEKLGIPQPVGMNEIEKEMAVLERICSPSIR